MSKNKKYITSRKKDFSRWYIDVVTQAGLVDYSPVKGCIVFRPYGYALWEGVKDALDKKIKDMDVDNAYFPLFIPKNLLEREKKHITGFSPELAVVTIGGGKELEEPLIIRPTSETIMYEMFSKWIQSWRDLPFKINQWCNVVRWEKRTLPFLRTTEFLWQEGHTAHATHEEAREQVQAAMNMYVEIYQDVLSMYGIVGYKSEAEKFAGGLQSMSYETLMPNGKALQSCTSHDLGQNFAKVFHVTFQNRKGSEEYVWQTSWGLSTRSLGGLVMAHSDDDGLVLPPYIAPIQVVIVPIYANEEEKSRVVNYIHSIEKQFKNIRIKVDKRDEYSPGWKFNEWEVKGVPLRLEIGPKEVANNTTIAVRRDTGEKIEIDERGIKKQIDSILKNQSREALKRSKAFTEKNTHKVDTYDAFKEIMLHDRGFIKAFWCGDPKCETKIKEETKATTRCLPLNSKKEKGKCIYCGKDAVYRWLFAQAY